MVEFSLPESGRLEFEEFVTLAAKFIVEEDAEALEKELREAFRLYDKEGECLPTRFPGRVPQDLRVTLGPLSEYNSLCKCISHPPAVAGRNSPSLLSLRAVLFDDQPRGYCRTRNWRTGRVGARRDRGREINLSDRNSSRFSEPVEASRHGHAASTVRMGTNGMGHWPKIRFVSSRILHELRCSSSTGINVRRFTLSEFSFGVGSINHVVPSNRRKRSHCFRPDDRA